MSNEITEYNLPIDSYASFDAQSLRDLIIEKLNNDSTISFTDQNFEGSNLNSIIDIISYSFHTLMFYLNQTSSESIFSDAQLYENMNRIVKLLDYKPLGRQSSVVQMNLKATEGLDSGYYTLPKLSFVTSNGKTYTATDNITFRKVSDSSTTETLSAIDSTLFYEGRVREYPAIQAIGEDYEVINLLPGSDVIVDHFNVFVFVKETNDDTWYEYSRTPSLYLNGSNERVFDLRFNQNKNYEIKFGNDINGKKLTAGDTVAIYYVQSTGVDGQITKNNFSESKLNIFNTTQYDEIFADVKDTSLTYVSLANSVYLNATNSEDSTLYSEEESVDDIRQNSPKFFKSEYKLITKNDYESFITRNFNNFVYDVRVSNNSDYLNVFKKYLTDKLGLNSFEDFNNALFNQYLYSDSFDVNNLFVTIVPKFKKPNSVVTRSNYISSALKNEILNEIRKYKILNGEITFLDPVYLEIDFLLQSANEPNRLRYVDDTTLVIQRSTSTIINDNSIKNKVFTILKNYFDAATLGMTIDVKQLNNDINSIDGVAGFYTYRSDIDLSSDGLSLGIYNPVHNAKDLTMFQTNYSLDYFQIPYIRNLDDLKEKITVKQVTETNLNTEY